MNPDIATLPSLFFAAVMSENENGSTIYGNDVYLKENRKNSKIKFPIESTSKMCQVNKYICSFEMISLSVTYAYKLI